MNKFITWIKSVLPTPKKALTVAVDSLDMAVPFIASEINKIEAKFKGMNAIEQAQWLVDKVQVFLRKQFKLAA